jgi:hypothetical protein
LQNTNAPSPELAHQACLMAARCLLVARLQQRARAFDDTDFPPQRRHKYLFVPSFRGVVLWGTMDLNEPARPTANPFAVRYGHFQISQSQGGAIEPRARCKIGYCYIQLASTNAQYRQATNEFHQTINATAADVATRSEAEYLLASVLEKQATDPAKTEAERRELLASALDHYLNVIYDKRLRADLKEQPHLYWVNRAG